MKIIFKFFITFFLILIIIIGYLSIFGYETDRFNEQITKKIKQIDENLEIKLKPIKIIFNPLELKFNIKTIGSSLIKQKKIIEIESIKTQIPLSSLFAEKLLLKKLEISSKSLEIKNFV